MRHGNTVKEILDSFERNTWDIPEVDDSIPQGDMPGDRIRIYGDSVKKAEIIFPLLTDELRRLSGTEENRKFVVSVCGGSGVGKTTIASVLAYYFNQLGIGAYTLSGDNYPKRLPVYNDAERIHRFQEGGIREMIREGCYSGEVQERLNELQRHGSDADPKQIKENPWLESYIRGGVHALQEYLGTEAEIDYALLNRVIADFKAGQSEIWLKRMGSAAGDIWFERKDFSDIHIIILEWTHGNSEFLNGVDIPVYLDSTPEETLEFRKKRNRDTGADSPFVTRVLEIEQNKLYLQAGKAKIIMSRDGKVEKKSANY